MSHLDHERIACPGCGATKEHRIFRSLNGERVASQVERLLDGTFERVTCSGCGVRFRPEHRMLYAHYGLRAWVVMHPPEERHRFEDLEPAVEALFARNFANAPAVVSAGLRGVRPRLVFGQHMLSEAVRVAESSMDPALLECAKLLVYRRSLGDLASHGAIELCYEGRARSSERLQMGVHALRSGTRMGALEVASSLLDEVKHCRDELEGMYPALFSRSYVSATRYLFGCAVVATSETMDGEAAP